MMLILGWRLEWEPVLAEVAVHQGFKEQVALIRQNFFLATRVMSPS